MYYVMDLNMTVIWLVILVALVVIELLTMGLTTIWFAGSFFIRCTPCRAGYPVFGGVRSPAVFYKTPCREIL